MGVKGLMTYIINDGSSLKPYKLRNTKVIIDGNNLLHSLHHVHNINWQFGGEYDAFEKAFIKFFERLKSCDLEPIVIFDGCYDAQGSKLKTTISRFKDRIYTCSKLNKQYPSNGYLLPMLAIQSMIPVLQRLKIYYVTCHEEADREAAALSNFLNCPIISNDSDFFIFQLTCGFIPVGNLNFIPVSENCTCCAKKNHQYLPCSLFIQSNLIVKHPDYRPVQTNLMPLFSTLMGNDFLTINFFDMIFYQNSNSRKSKSTSKVSSKINSFLKWVHQFDSVESALETVLLSVKEIDRDRLKKSINQSLAQYDLSRSNLVNSFTNNFDNCDGSDSICLANENGIFSQLPIYVQQRLDRCILSPILLNSILSGKVFLQTYVESIQNDSIHSISSKLRESFYGILFKLLKKPCDQVFEYTRSGTSISKRSIVISELIPESLVSTLLEDDTRFSFVKLMISYWIKLSDKAHLNEYNALAMIVSVVMQFSWQQELSTPLTEFTKQRYEHPSYKFFKDPVITSRHKFQIDYVHCFNELQSIYFSLIQLLSLSPDFNTDWIVAPQSIFCGKLCYNLSQDLKKRRNPWSYACQLFEEFPSQQYRSKFLEVIEEVRTAWPGFDRVIVARTPEEEQCQMEI